MPPKSSNIFTGFVYYRDGSTAMANQKLKFTNEKSGDSFLDQTNDSGEFVTDLANFDRGWSTGQTIKIEIYDDTHEITDWDFYIGTSRLGLVYNYQYVADPNEWKTLTADKGSIKINTASNPHGYSNLEVYKSP